jgi:nucleoid DNA-binding protein
MNKRANIIKKIKSILKLEYGIELSTKDIGFCIREQEKSLKEHIKNNIPVSIVNFGIFQTNKNRLINVAKKKEMYKKRFNQVLDTPV